LPKERRRPTHQTWLQ